MDAALWITRIVSIGVVQPMTRVSTAATPMSLGFPMALLLRPVANAGLGAKRTMIPTTADAVAV